jgi:Tol biopolymer transport system component
MCDLPGCGKRQPLTVPDNRSTGLCRWTPDGQAIAYVDAAHSNIWVQPLDGHAPHQLTHFADGRTIADFAWSHDGKRLAISRSTTTNDIALFKGLKE